MRTSRAVCGGGILCLALGLQGCGPDLDCNGKDVKATALEIIKSKMEKMRWYSDMEPAISGNIEITSIKTLAKNDETKQRGCSGNYTFKYNGSQKEMPFEYETALLQDKGEAEVRVDVEAIVNGMMRLALSEPPVKNGVQVIRDPDTKAVVHKITWKNNAKNGLEEFFNYANGKLIQSINWEDNKKVGLEREWDVGGEYVKKELNWVNGKASGFQKVKDVDTGKVLIDMTYKDNNGSGFMTDGVRELSPKDPKDGWFNYQEMQYKDGMLDGPKKYYESNRDSSALRTYLVAIENYKADKLHGWKQKFDKSGNVVEQEFYQEGVLATPPAGQGLPGRKANAAEKWDPKIAACIDLKSKAYTKQAGEDALIKSDILNEWEAECAKAR